jgi:hypothetical protein
MSRQVRLLAFGAAIWLLCACTASTVFTSTWKSPDAVRIDPAGKTVVAVFVTSNEGQRRSAEDLLAADLTAKGAHGIPSYTLVTNDQRGDAEGARYRFKSAGASGIVVMRVVGKDQQVTYSPGAPMPAYYGGFGPYWGYGWSNAYSPGYLQTDTLISVETLIYSVQQDKLLWAGTSRTTNPNDLSALIGDVANAVTQELTKQGLLGPSP